MAEEPPPRPVVPHPPEGRAAVAVGDTLRVEMAETVTARPGETATVQLRILNVGDVVERATLRLAALPHTEWLRLAQDEVALFPAGSAVVDLLVEVPEGPVGSSGPVPFEVELTAASTGRSAGVRGSVVLELPERVHVSVEPAAARVRRRARFTVLLRNEEPVPHAYTVEAQPGSSELRSPGPRSGSVAPHSRAVVRLPVRLAWNAARRRHPLRIRAQVDDRPPVFADAEVHRAGVLSALTPRRRRSASLHLTERARGEAAQFALLSDHPAGGADDQFGYAAIADALARTILVPGASTPMTIGIQGSWGSGKSTLMGLVSERLRREQELPPIPGQDTLRLRTVWFNAWTAEGSSALSGLIRTVLPELDPSVLRRLVRRGRSSSWVRLSLVLVAGWFGVGALADAVWKRFDVDAHTRNQVRMQLLSALDEWVRRGEAAGERRLLVVFIDDLDRCSPANVLEVFEAIKVYLDAPGFVFVVGYDDAIITDAVLASQHYAAGTTGRDYLEKILQVDYRLPRADADQGRRLALACLRRSGAGQLLGRDEIQIIVDRSGHNPRRIKRFLNAFTLGRQLDPNAASFTPGEYAKLLLLQVYVPAFYALLLDDAEPDPFTDILALARARSTVDPEGDSAREVLADVCRRRHLPPPDEEEDSTALLRRVADALPEQVATLAQDRSFVALAWAMGEDEQRRDLLARLRTSAPRVDTLAPSPVAYRCERCGELNTVFRSSCVTCGHSLTRGESPPVPVPSPIPIMGRTLLWYDPDGHARASAERLSAMGAFVVVADTQRALRQALAGHPAPCAVIVAVSEPQGARLALDEVRELLAGSPFAVPVLAWGDVATSPDVKEVVVAHGALPVGADETALAVTILGLPVVPSMRDRRPGRDGTGTSAAGSGRSGPRDGAADVAG